MIKEWFANYKLHHADVTFSMKSGETVIHSNGIEPWNVTLVETGEDTMTGGRIKRASKYIDDDVFLLTYGDGLGNIDIRASIKFHKDHGRMATMTAVQPDGRFGAFTLNEGQKWLTDFNEKPKGDGAWINAGYFVLNKNVVDFIEGDDTSWELEPLQKLAEQEQIAAFRHNDFWMPMDTLRDKNVLEEHWHSNKAPWKSW